MLNFFKTPLEKSKDYFYDTTFVSKHIVSNNLYINMLNQPHLLIAGATGSGKSVLVNNLIYTLISQHPEHNRLILIDPKRVELYKYRILPHSLRYASEPNDIARVLKYAISLMESRYINMRTDNKVMYEGCDVYIFIDELADLLTTSKKEVLPLIQRLAQLGRAARIHLVMATQRPTKDILSGQLKVNLDSRVALRCPTAVDSRNIINIPGAEKLKRYGTCLYLTPELTEPKLYNIDMVSQYTINDMIKYWQEQLGIGRTYIEYLVNQ